MGELDWKSWGEGEMGVVEEVCDIQNAFLILTVQNGEHSELLPHTML